MEVTRLMLSKYDKGESFEYLKEHSTVLQPGVRCVTIGLDTVAPLHNGRLVTILDNHDTDKTDKNLDKKLDPHNKHLRHGSLVGEGGDIVRKMGKLKPSAAYEGNMWKVLFEFNGTKSLVPDRFLRCEYVPQTPFTGQRVKILGSKFMAGEDLEYTLYGVVCDEDIYGFNRAMGGFDWNKEEKAIKQLEQDSV